MGTPNPRVRGARRTALLAELAQRFLDGDGDVAITSVAESTGYRPSTVRRFLAEAGVRSSRCLIGLSDEEVTAELVARRQGGVSVPGLVAVTGLDEKDIRGRLRAAGGVRVTRRRTRLAMTADELAAAYDTGAPTIQDLADHVGGSYGTVRRMLLEAGVQLRPRGGGPRRESGGVNGEENTTS